MLVYDRFVYPVKPVCEDDIVILHSGFSSTEPNFKNGRDIRDYYLIHYITKGKGTYQTTDHCYKLKEGEGFLSFPNSPFFHTADENEPWDLCWIAFFGKKVEELLKMAGLDRNHLTFRYGKDAFLENCIQNIYNASRNGKNFLYITAQFYLFMSKLADEYEKRNQTDEAVVSTLPFEEALGYIHRNIRNKISVNDLAAFLRLDTSQVYRIFKANTGKSPKQVICDMQIQKCCDFLTKTDLSVREIAEWMGYEYQSHFSKHFQSNVGMSPSEYRKKYT